MSIGIPMIDNQARLGGLLMVFVSILVGLALIGSIGDESNKTFTLDVVTNESVDATSALIDDESFDPSVELSLANANLTGFSELRMQNGTAITQDVDYIANLGNGTLKILNTTTTRQYANGTQFGAGNTTFADYEFAPDEYVKNAVARVFLRFNTLWFAIAILAMIAGFVINQYRNKD